jgi:5S rRNA maturation endonuclease (ribonuclease M5)
MFEAQQRAYEEQKRKREELEKAAEALKRKAQEFENISSEERIIILTDFDDEGEELAARLYKAFKSRKVEIDLEVRRKLSSLLKGEIKGLEELEPLISRISQQFKISPLFNGGYYQ